VEALQIYSAEMGHIPVLSYRICAHGRMCLGGLHIFSGITFSGKWRWDGHRKNSLLLEVLNKGHEKRYLLYLI